MGRTLLAMALALMALGCGAKRVKVEVPPALRAESLATVRAAEQSGAARVPEAATFLGFAQQQVAEAERLMAQGLYEAAELQLRQATADAQLALALARAIPLEREAQRLERQAEALRRNPR